MVAGQGVYATRDIAEGELITLYPRYGDSPELQELFQYLYLIVIILAIQVNQDHPYMCTAHTKSIHACVYSACDVHMRACGAYDRI